jgi:hypothetical protein
MPADVLVGRRLTVDALRSAVDAAMAGAGGIVLLAGEAGMGKTALAAEAAAYAKARGAVEICWPICSTGPADTAPRSRRDRIWILRLTGASDRGVSGVPAVLQPNTRRWISRR